MDRFEAMRVFSRVVERRSFTLAADALGVQRWTVTDAVKSLEARLGVRLLERTTRQVRPTLDGEAHYRRCLSLIADLEDAEGAFGGAGCRSPPILRRPKPPSAPPSRKDCCGLRFRARWRGTSCCRICRAS